MKQSFFELTKQNRITEDVYELHLQGDTSAIKRPGQFVNIKIDGCFLRRPISVCDCVGNELVLVYRTVGEGTAKLSKLPAGTDIDVLSGLGNGFDVSLSGNTPLLVGGGVGTPPLFMLAKILKNKGADVKVVLGFRSKKEVFYEREFRSLGCEVRVATVDGSYGTKGFVTDILPDDYSCYYAVGPEPMLKAVFTKAESVGQLSFERRMGCGFGACMGCSCRTITGYKRICKEGPVLSTEEIIWKD